jgi:glycine cleavage system H lipoate-binding protein
MAGRKTYVQDPETGKFVEKQAYLASINAPHVHVMQPFKSPIDGSIIRDPAQLRAHNRKHGVTDRRDYGESWFERKQNDLELKRQQLDRESKKDRINALIRATEHIRT